MDKKKVFVAVLAVAACLFAGFLTVLFLCLPLGGRMSVLSPVVLYVVGGVLAGISLLAGIGFFVRFRQGG